jgi:haloalkane dehalogenase
MSYRRENLAEKGWRSLYPFASREHSVAGGRMHYLDEGPATGGDGGPATLLFVHGNPTWSFHWRRLITVLRGTFRCVAPDHLGCGLSDKPQRQVRLAEHIENLASLVDALELRNVTLVAQDWGGAIGLGAMLRASERLARIVLFNTGAFPPPRIPWRIRACRLPIVGRLAVQGLNLFSRAALHMTLSRTRRLEPVVAAGYLAPYDHWRSRRAVYGFVEDIPAGPRHPTWQTLVDIERGLATLADRPILLVWGMRDWCFRPECLERLLGHWPRAETRRMPDVGHWVVEDAPDDALHCVQEFLTTRRTDVPSISL